MDFVIRLFYTLRYLQLIQLVFQIRLRIVRVFPSKKYLFGSYDREILPKRLEIDFPSNNKSFFKFWEYSFLNLTKKFDNDVDWNFNEYGKLWNYNLQYLDYLNQSDISLADAEIIINSISNNIEKDSLKMEPYPASLRIVNLAKYAMKRNVKNPHIDKLIGHHATYLLENLEYHLLANHLLENAIAILIASVYLNNKFWFNSGGKLVKEQLNEQLLKDGAHYEQSSMYHCIILTRLLDAINIIENIDNSFEKAELINRLREDAGKMQAYLKAIVFINGDIPMVNDAAPYIAIEPTRIFSYAQKLGIQDTKIKLGESGFRKYSNGDFELFADYGDLLPIYQPGHAHSDTFNIIVYQRGIPFLVEMGTSTYQNNERRKLERSSFAHNTVVVNKENQSDVWGAFRVGKRAKVMGLIETKNSIEAFHDGYSSFGVFHKRRIEIESRIISIEDTIIAKKQINSEALFHLHPDVQIIEKTNTTLVTNLGVLAFNNSSTITISSYEYSIGFNSTKEAKLITVKFKDFLKTNITTT
jgi:uncharacterized heparinase superfamily protein